MGQLGLEPTVKMFQENILLVTSELYRILKPSGTMWLNLGDSYFTGGGPRKENKDGNFDRDLQGPPIQPNRLPGGAPVKSKSLVGVPWRVALAMMDDQGWILRSEIIWSKSNPMPESCKDRPTRAHEQVFLFTKKSKYYYDPSYLQTEPQKSSVRIDGLTDMVNARDVWSLPVSSSSEAHFATYPSELVKRCILSGCPLGGKVLDPFSGSGTTVAVSVELGRYGIGFELSRKYWNMSVNRMKVTNLNLFTS